MISICLPSHRGREGGVGTLCAGLCLPCLISVISVFCVHFVMHQLPQQLGIARSLTSKKTEPSQYGLYYYYLKCLLSFYIIILWPNHSGRTTKLYNKNSHLTSFIHNIKSSSLIYTLKADKMKRCVLCWPLLQLTMLLVTFHTLKFLYSVASSLACKTQKSVWMCWQITHRVLLQVRSFRW
jgi:hypothetical protein